MDKICFSKDTFYTYSFILLIILIYYVYIYYNKYYNFDSNNGLSNDNLKTRLDNIQSNLYNLQLDNQRCNYQLTLCKNNLSNSICNKTNNTTGPERVYLPTHSNSSTYTLLGYVYKDTDRFPLYGRYKYPGRSDRWEYYVIDETRNRLKIPFDTTNFAELYDDDLVNIPTLGDNYSVKIYEYKNLRYNPNY